MSAAQVKKKTSPALTKVKKSKIFISWSGEYTKAFATKLKSTLEDVIFRGYGLECFVSSEDIGSGTDWFNKVKKELRTCQMGIVCITKENVLAPWLYFEAGAMIHKQVMIPLLLNCNKSILDNNPLHGKQAVEFHQQNEFRKMVCGINTTMGFEMEKAELDQRCEEAHRELKKELSEIFEDLKGLRTFNLKYVYPGNVTAVKVKSVFISAPMSSIGPEEYQELRNAVLQIKEMFLRELKFENVYCPMIDAETQAKFEGKNKAIKSNFPLMKQVDSMLVIYPWKNASSALVEIGYGIALSKKMVVFYREGIPYIVEGAAKAIGHITKMKFDSYSDIVDAIKMNGEDIFNDVEFPEGEEQ